MATGIMSYGGYIPRLRLNRMSIYQSMGWFAPATVMVAQGERSFCNWDEDSLTMAVEASRDCLAGMDKRLLIETPLMWLDKAQTWALAESLGGAALVDVIVEHSHSCYLGDREHRHAWGWGCGSCPACELRARGWEKYSGSGEA